MNLCGLCTDGGKTAIFVYLVQKTICEKNHKQNVKLDIDVSQSLYYNGTEYPFDNSCMHDKIMLLVTANGSKNYTPIQPRSQAQICENNDKKCKILKPHLCIFLHRGIMYNTGVKR